LKRFIGPNEIANVVTFVYSGLAFAINGAALVQMAGLAD
jgi:hypothetical protein